MRWWTSLVKELSLPLWSSGSREPNTVTIIGWDGSALSLDANKALASATLIVGSDRLLAAVPISEGATIVPIQPLATALEPSQTMMVKWSYLLAEILVSLV